MATTVTSQPLDIGATLVIAAALNATLIEDVTGGSGVLNSMHIENSSGTIAYLYLYDAATATVGTTGVDWCFKCPANAEVCVGITDAAGKEGGVAFTNLSIAAAQEAAGSGTTNPASALNVSFIIKPD
jgi:hypothetical protein